MHNNSSRIKESLVNLPPSQISTVGKMIVSNLYEDGSMLEDKDKKILVRSSVVLKKVTHAEEIKMDSEGVIDKISNYPSRIQRLVKSSSNDDFNRNIQQLKLKEFDVLYYLLFFDDIIEIFKVNSNDITSIPTYSPFQHKDNTNEAQFYINRESYNNYRRENSRCDQAGHDKVRYDELNKYLK